ncbi:MAG: ABC transporter substrate-binding protein [Solirubrobacterales bacterium]
MKLSIAPESSKGLLATLTATVLAFALVAVSFAGLADSASAAPPKRVVALTPFAANTMADLGVLPKAVGQVLNTSDERSTFNSKIDAGIRRGKIKVLTLTHPNGPNLEQLAKRRIDFVYSSSQWSKGTSGMKSLGIKVQTADPLGLGQTWAKTNAIARKLGKAKAGKKLVRKRRAQVAKSTKNIKSRPKVMVILGVGRTPFTFLGSSWGGKLVKAAGGALETGGANASGGFARISDEVVIAEQPEIIIAVPHAETKNIDEAIEYLKNNPAWGNTPAAQNDRIYVSTDNSLLQADGNPAKVINRVRSQYLKNR